MITVEQAENNLLFRKIPGTSHYYSKQKSDIEAESRDYQRVGGVGEADDAWKSAQ